ncbi:MAG TPA: hypothetical protein PKK94_16880 [Leptospiraceae bacterium]|nr:hypothetical protein [Leptospiraceae bacterium]
MKLLSSYSVNLEIHFLVCYAEFLICIRFIFGLSHKTIKPFIDRIVKVLSGGR